VNGSPSERHYPGRAAIEGYGSGGFRFAGMSHRGSILLLPSGIWAWPPRGVSDIDAANLARPVAEAAEMDLFLLGTGRDPWPLPTALHAVLKDAGLRVDTMPTAAAASTYNVLLAEGRRVGAGLIATE
jgi:uncharacterized protein